MSLAALPAPLDLEGDSFSVPAVAWLPRATVLVQKQSSPGHEAGWSACRTVGQAGCFTQGSGGKCCLIKHLISNELEALTTL